MYVYEYDWSPDSKRIAFGCTDTSVRVVDADGKIVELKCSIDRDTLGKNPVGRKVKGVIHWLSVEHAVPAEIRLYDRLFTEQ